jgi:hypothetical protein|tara:strand:+ start:52 stop:594 length:543 start_codon:yes stop_codon:yes gene_type:complete
MYLKPASPRIFNERIKGIKLQTKYLVLFNRITKESRCFDTHDNCFQLSLRDMAGILGINHASISRLFNYLRSKDLLRAVKDIEDKDKWMIDPRFYWKHIENEYNFHTCMYIQGSHAMAWGWLKTCRSVEELFDPETGDMLGYFDTQLDKAYAKSYSKSDRDKYRVPQKGFKEEETNDKTN